jgi:hypothetical protein
MKQSERVHCIVKTQALRLYSDLNATFYPLPIPHCQLSIVNGNIKYQLINLSSNLIKNKNLWQL